MEQHIEPNVWTAVGDTGIELRWAGAKATKVRTDERGAVVLPKMTAEEKAGAFLWDGRGDAAPICREDQPLSLVPGQGPAGFQLVEGRWVRV